MKNLKYFLIIAFCVITFAMANKVAACICDYRVEGDDILEFYRAEALFIGRVISSKNTPSQVEVIFDVHKVYKGDIPNPLTVIVKSGPCQFLDFEKDKTYIVSGYEFVNDKLYSYGLMSCVFLNDELTEKNQKRLDEIAAYDYRNFNEEAFVSRLDKERQKIEGLWYSRYSQLENSFLRKIFDQKYFLFSYVDFLYVLITTGLFILALALLLFLSYIKKINLNKIHIIWRIAFVVLTIFLVYNTVIYLIYYHNWV